MPHKVQSICFTDPKFLQKWLDKIKWYRVVKSDLFRPKFLEGKIFTLGLVDVNLIDLLRVHGIHSTDTGAEGRKVTSPG